MSLTYIINGKIVIPDSVVCDKFLVFDQESGKICGITAELPADAQTIDAKGNYVAPGLIDIHIHGYLGPYIWQHSSQGCGSAYGVSSTYLDHRP